MADQQRFSDSELLQIASDSRTTPQDLALLSAVERGRLQQLTMPKDEGSKAMDLVKGVAGFGGDLLTGAAKGAGNTAFNLGSAVRMIPGIGHATDALAKAFGPEGTNPEQAFARTPADLEATNNTQKVGKFAEQVAEFVLPGKASLTAGSYAARPALNAWLGMSQKARPLASKALQLGEKGLNIAGDALMSGAVGAAHGDDPVNAAEWSAGGSLAGQGLSQLLRTLSTKTGQQIGPLLAAIAAMSAVEGAGGGMAGTLGGGLGGFSVARSIAQRAIGKPGAVRRLRDLAEDMGTKAGLIGAEASSGPKRRTQ